LQDCFNGCALYHPTSWINVQQGVPDAESTGAGTSHKYKLVVLELVGLAFELNDLDTNPLLRLFLEN